MAAVTESGNRVWSSIWHAAALSYFSNLHCMLPQALTQIVLNESPNNHCCDGDDLMVIGKAAVHTGRISADSLPWKNALSVALSQRACKAAQQG